MILQTNYKDVYDGLVAQDDGGAVYRRIKSEPVRYTYDRKMSHAGNQSARPAVMQAVDACPTGHWLHRRVGPLPHYAGQRNYVLFPVALFFCGRIWLGMRDEVYNEQKSKWVHNFFWTPEQAVRAYPVAADWLGTTTALTNRRVHTVHSDWEQNYPNRLTTSPVVPEVMALHRLAQSPVVLAEDRDVEVLVNPVLKDINFASQVPVHQLAQEISMFVDGILAASLVPAPRPITDVLRAEIAGFDKTTSFRNQKNRKAASRSDWE